MIEWPLLTDVKAVEDVVGWRQAGEEQRVGRVKLSAAIAFGIVWASTFALADAPDDCDQHADWALRIDGCTEAIRSGTWPREDLAGAYYRRAFSYVRLGEFDRAISDFDRVLSLDPGKTRTYRGRAQAYEALGQSARAVADYDRRLKDEPADVVALALRGSSYRSLGQIAQAVQDWEQSIRLDDAGWIGQWWQMRLRDRGHYPGEITGSLDESTRAALRACARDPDC